MSHDSSPRCHVGGRSRSLSALALAALCFWLYAVPVAAQLDQSCTVSALNRTAPVDASGVWVLPGVPSNLSPVRVRATCFADGMTRSGESGFFQVPDGAGVQVQLSVTGHYSDGGAADLTAADSGTDYRVSNSAVITIDGDGLLTAHSSGAVVVSAVNEGALAVLRIEVVAAAD